MNKYSNLLEVMRGQYDNLLMILQELDSSRFPYVEESKSLEESLMRVTKAFSDLVFISQSTSVSADVEDVKSTAVSLISLIISFMDDLDRIHPLTAETKMKYDFDPLQDNWSLPLA